MSQRINTLPLAAAAAADDYLMLDGTVNGSRRLLVNPTGTGQLVFGGAPSIIGGSITALTNFGVRSTGAAFDLKLASSEVLTANRTLSVVLGDVARTLTMSGDATLGNWFDQSVKKAASPTFVGLLLNANTAAAPATGLTGITFQVVGADGQIPGVMVDGFGGPPAMILRRANGTNATKTAIQNGDLIGVLLAYGYGATAYSTAARGFLQFNASETWTDTAQGTSFRVSVAPTGSATISTIYDFSSQGAVQFSNAVSGTIFTITSAGAITGISCALTNGSAPLLLTNTAGGSNQLRFTTAGATNIASLGSDPLGNVQITANTVSSFLLTATGINATVIGATTPAAATFTTALVSSNGTNTLGITGSSANSQGLYIANTISGGHTWGFYSSGGGPSALGSFAIYDSTDSQVRLTIQPTTGLVVLTGGLNTYGDVLITGLAGSDRQLNIISPYVSGVSHYAFLNIHGAVQGGNYATIITLYNDYPGNTSNALIGMASGAIYLSDASYVPMLVADPVAGVRLKGTTINDAATAGAVGEYIESRVFNGAAVPLTTAIQTNITSITLTPGDWDVTGVIGFQQGPTTVVNFYVGSISLVTAVLGLDKTTVGGGTLSKNGVNGEAPVPTVRVSVASTTVVYLVAFADFSVSTLTAYGFLRARRVR